MALCQGITAQWGGGSFQDQAATAAAAYDRSSPAAHLLMLLIKKLRLRHAARP